MPRTGDDVQSGQRCRCCAGDYANTFEVASWRSPEWSPFRYGECGQCGSLTLIDSVDPASFYVDGYWGTERPRPPASGLRRSLGTIAAHTVMPATVVARLVPRVVPRPEWLTWFAGSGLTLSSAILDVGAGPGSLLRELQRWGFSDLTGVDPYLPGDRVESPELRFQACHLSELPRTDYSVALFHHSLEHVDNPIEMLHLARQRISGRGARIVIALPVAQGPAWETYRDNWSALDAPLHRFIPTLDGLRRLAATVGMELGRISPSSPAHHFIGSELVARRRRPTDSPLSVMSSSELEQLRRTAAAAKSVARCPQLSVVLTPKGTG